MTVARQFLILPKTMKRLRSRSTPSLLWKLAERCRGGLSVGIAQQIDAIFAVEGLPYRMTTVGIEWRNSEAAVIEIKEAERLLLDDPKFAGPAAQWEKARQHLASRPPDPENCIKDAIGAVEGIARILQNSNATLGKIIKLLGTKLKIHVTLTNSISSLYAYRGDEQGVAHGATAAPSDLIPEAEFVLHTSAAAIVFLIRKAEVI